MASKPLTIVKPKAAPTDDKVRERHGCAVSAGYISLRESGGCLYLLVSDSSGSYVQHTERPLQAEDARYLARKLYRLARRVEARRS